MFSCNESHATITNLPLQREEGWEITTFARADRRSHQKKGL